MDIIACIISLIFFVLSIYLFKNKKSISPIVLFFALWTFILFLSLLNLYEIYKPSNEAYFLIILMLIFFFAGSFLRNALKNKNKLNENGEETNLDDKIKPKFIIFYVLSFSIILLNVIDIIIVIKEAIGGTPMWKIRNWSLEPYGSSNPLLDRRSFIEECFRSIILGPFSTIIYPIVAYCFFDTKYNKKQRYQLLITSIIVLLTSSIAGGGGRLGIIYYFGCFALAFFTMYKNKNIKSDTIKKYLKMIITILVLGLIIVILFTIIRTGLGNFIKQTYTYFALPPTLLSEWLPEIKNIPHTYGMTTFFGLHSYFFRILDTIGLDCLVPQIYYDTYNYILNAEIFKNVGYGVANAFVTPIYYFYIDGGYLFTCIASFLFGYIVSREYDKFEKNINIRSFTIYALIMYGIFVSFMRIQTAIPAYIISFILAGFVLKKTKKSNINRNKHKKNIDNEAMYEEKETKDLISIIVPVYNADKYLEECINSLINQTYKNLEIILVDDGSIDESPNICDEYLKKDSRVKVIHQENKGVSEARNRGIEEARGKWIAFVDADDYIDLKFCEKMLEIAIKENAQCVICGYNRVYLSKKEALLKEKSFSMDSDEFLNNVFMVQSGFGFAHMKLWDANLLKKSNIRFDKELKVAEDAFFCMQISKEIKKIYYLNEALYNYRFNEQSVVRKFDKNYVQKYLIAMKKTKEYIRNNDEKNTVKLYNYIAYHVLLIIINYCFHPGNNESGMKSLKQVCKIPEFEEAVKKSNYKGFSLTRKITLFTLKHKLYLVTCIIAKIRQSQNRK